MIRQILTLLTATASVAVLASAAPAPTASAPAGADIYHDATISGAYGWTHYMERSSAPIRRLHVFARDSKADGYCAETWVDYTTSPHRHYDPYLVFACGNGKAGYGPEFTTNHDNPNGFRMAVCKARTRNSKPEGCKLWNTDNNFAVEAWQHGKYKKFEAR